MSMKRLPYLYPLHGKGSHYYEMHYHEIKKKHTLPKPGKSGRMVILPFHLPSYIEKETYDEIIELSLMSTVNFRDFISIEYIIIIAELLLLCFLNLSW